MTVFQNIILFTNRYGNLQEMLEMASFLKYVDLYLTSAWGRFYVGHPVFASPKRDLGANVLVRFLSNSNNGDVCYALCLNVCSVVLYVHRDCSQLHPMN
jgi:hypothetical protein